MVKTTRDVTVGINSVTGEGERLSSSEESESTEYGDMARLAVRVPRLRVEPVVYP